MKPGIFLIQDNEELVEMNEQEYDSEKLLQTWLAKYPELLVGNQIDGTKPRFSKNGQSNRDELIKETPAGKVHAYKAECTEISNITVCIECSRLSLTG